MTINDIISKYHPKFSSECDPTKRYYNSKTEEDFLQDTYIAAMTRFGDDDITEEDGLQYIEKTFYRLKMFKMQHMCTDKLIYVEDISKYDSEDY